MVSEARARLDSGCLPACTRADEQSYAKMPAQQGHRRVLEVEPEAGKLAGRLRDDPRAVPADRGDVRRRVLTTQRFHPSSLRGGGAPERVGRRRLNSLPRPVEVLCSLGGGGPAGARPPPPGSAMTASTPSPKNRSRGLGTMSALGPTPGWPPTQPISPNATTTRTPRQHQRQLCRVQPRRALVALGRRRLALRGARGERRPAAGIGHFEAISEHAVAGGAASARPTRCRLTNSQSPEQ